MATLYVHPDGTDGTTVPATQTDPLKTLQYGVNRAGVGDTVAGMSAVHPGRVRVKSNITLKGLGGGVEMIGGRPFRAAGGAVIDGGGAGGDLVYALDADNITNFTLEGFEIRNTAAATVSIPRCKFVTVQDNLIHDSIRPGIIHRESDLLLVQRNHLYDVAKQNASAAGNAISILRAEDKVGATPADWGGFRTILRWNCVHDIVQNAGTPMTDGGGIAWDGAADIQIDYTGPWLIEGNIVYDCAGSGIRIIWAKNGWVVQNTSISNCDHPDRTSDFGAGIQMYKSRELHFFGNITDEDRVTPSTLLTYGFQDTSAANVLYDDGTAATGPSEHSKNFYRGPLGRNARVTPQFNGAPGTMPSAGANSLGVDPMFVNRAARNLALQTGSPARNQNAWPGYVDAGAVQSSVTAPFEVATAPVVAGLDATYPVSGDSVTFTAGTYTGGSGTVVGPTWKWQTLGSDGVWVDGAVVTASPAPLPAVGEMKTSVSLLETITKGTVTLTNRSTAFDVSPSTANGSDSSFNGHTPNGGGAGGRYHATVPYIGQAGGSGGGGYGHGSGTNHAAGAASPAGQGNAGGVGFAIGGGGGGGGGGAGGAGAAAVAAAGGAGGAGLTFASVLPAEFASVAAALGLTGAFASFSPGGGGGISAAGGAGGGGSGGGTGVVPAMAATTYGGGGGGRAVASSNTGGPGFPGIVVIAVAKPSTLPALISDTTVRAASADALPAYLAEYTDPNFGTKLKRISNNGNAITGGGGATWGADARPHYSSVQAWNADESLIFLEYGASAGRVFLDGQTYAPAFVRSVPAGMSEARWHPTIPNQMLYTTSGADGQLRTWDVVANTTALIRTFTGYTDLNWRGEADMSDNGQRVALVGTLAGNTTVVIYRISDNTILGTINVTALGKSMADGHAMISPDGNYVHLYFDDETSATYTVAGTLLYNITSTQSPSHADVIKFNNTQYIVGPTRGSADGSGNIIRRQLSADNVVKICPTNYAYHTSARARSGLWTANTYHQDSGSPYAGSIVCSKLDGAASYRVCHHRSTGTAYAHEPHATLSPSGKRVLFGSDWGGGNAGAVHAFVADFRGFSLP